MIKTIASRQRGVSLSGLLIWSTLLILAAIVGMKVIPAYVQDAEIKSILSTIVNDSEMQGLNLKVFASRSVNAS